MPGKHLTLLTMFAFNTRSFFFATAWGANPRSLNLLSFIYCRFTGELQMLWHGSVHYGSKKFYNDDPTVTFER
jgi:hypothetical protein